ncbi:UNVERIFIED_CONTAM: hypothetical protein FKN15_033835 [Acipenser sinensis]
MVTKVQTDKEPLSRLRFAFGFGERRGQEARKFRLRNPSSRYRRPETRPNLRGRLRRDDRGAERDERETRERESERGEAMVTKVQTDKEPLSRLRFAFGFGERRGQEARKFRLRNPSSRYRRPETRPNLRGRLRRDDRGAERDERETRERESERGEAMVTKVQTDKEPLSRLRFAFGFGERRGQEARKFRLRNPSSRYRRPETRPNLRGRLRRDDRGAERDERETRERESERGEAMVTKVQTDKEPLSRLRFAFGFGERRGQEARKFRLRNPSSRYRRPETRPNLRGRLRRDDRGAERDERETRERESERGEAMVTKVQTDKEPLSRLRFAFGFGERRGQEARKFRLRNPSSRYRRPETRPNLRGRLRRDDRGAERDERETRERESERGEAMVTKVQTDKEPLSRLRFAFGFGERRGQEARKFRLRNPSSRYRRPETRPNLRGRLRRDDRGAERDERETRERESERGEAMVTKVQTDKEPLSRLRFAFGFGERRGQEARKFRLRNPSSRYRRPETRPNLRGRLRRDDRGAERDERETRERESERGLLLSLDSENLLREVSL